VSRWVHCVFQDESFSKRIVRPPITTITEGSMTASQPAAWARSRFCESNMCVEVAQVAESEIVVRDSKNPDVVLRFSRAEWAAFIAGARAGDFQFRNDH